MLVLFAVACGSAEHKAEKARDELQSWAATGAVLSRQWSRGDATPRYVKSTLKVATDSLQGLIKPLQGDEKSQKSLERVTQLYDTFQRAFDRNELKTARQTSDDFDAISKELQQQKQ
jgi:hypothetical protein